MPERCSLALGDLRTLSPHSANGFPFVFSLGGVIVGEEVAYMNVDSCLINDLVKRFAVDSVGWRLLKMYSVLEFFF